MRCSKSKAQLFALLTLLLIRLFQHLLSDGWKIFSASDQTYSRLYPTLLMSDLSTNLYVSLAGFCSYPVHTALGQFILQLHTYRSLLFPTLPGKLPVTSTDKQLRSKYSFFFSCSGLDTVFLEYFPWQEKYKWYNQY